MGCSFMLKSHFGIAFTRIALELARWARALPAAAAGKARRVAPPVGHSLGLSLSLPGSASLCDSDEQSMFCHKGNDGLRGA